jgi:hypothetical protein
VIEMKKKGNFPKKKKKEKRLVRPIRMAHFLTDPYVKSRICSPLGGARVGVVKLLSHPPIVAWKLENQNFIKKFV